MSRYLQYLWFVYWSLWTFNAVRLPFVSVMSPIVSVLKLLTAHYSLQLLSSPHSILLFVCCSSLPAPHTVPHCATHTVSHNVSCLSVRKLSVRKLSMLSRLSVQPNLICYRTSAVAQAREGDEKSQIKLKRNMSLWGAVSLVVGAIIGKCFWCQGMLSDVEGCWLLRGSEGCWGVLRGAEGCWGVLWGTEGCCTVGCWWVLMGANGRCGVLEPWRLGTLGAFRALRGRIGCCGALSGTKGHWARWRALTGADGCWRALTGAVVYFLPKSNIYNFFLRPGRRADSFAA